MRLRNLIGAALAAVAMGFASAAGAGALRIGEPVPSMALEDQHGKAVALPAQARWLLFAPDKAAADLAQQWIRSRGPGALEALGAVYLADISGMPSLVTKLIALPRLRELPFPVVLARDASLTADWPRRAGQLTLVALDGGRVLRIEHAATAPQISQHLQLPAGP
ncbi:MAG: hypothetical protein AB7U92_09885 [Piscinibacter sp.]|uniref:hypothetical protein n=1 Tax=Piscinibacter sp. TaxID=1903157 RepID=UPI003D11B4FC